MRGQVAVDTGVRAPASRAHDAALTSSPAPATALDLEPPVRGGRNRMDLPGDPGCATFAGPAGPRLAMRRERRNAAGAHTQELERSDVMMFAIALALIGFAVLPVLEHLASN